MTFSTQVLRAAFLLQVGPEILAALGKHLKSTKSQMMKLSKYCGRAHKGIWPPSKKVCSRQTRMLPENIVKVIISFHILTCFSLPTEQGDALVISRKVGALPLALHQAGSYISAMQIPFSTYLFRFESTFAEVAAKRPPTVVWQYRDDTVFTTWEVSFNALGPAAQELLLLFGFLENESISEELLPLERLNSGFRIGELSFLFLHLVNGLRLLANSQQL